MTTKLSNNNITSGTIPSVPVITSLQVADTLDNVVGTATAVDNLTGNRIIINGNNFVSGCKVGYTVNGVVVTGSAAFISSQKLIATLPANTTGSPVVFYVSNPNGSTALSITTLSYSPAPVWTTGTTLTAGEVNVNYNLNLSASESPTYTLTSGSLPSGITLSSAGLLSGVVTAAAATYNFTITATDAENQATARTFSLTISLPNLTVFGKNTPNSTGRLGLNDAINRSSPVLVGGITWRSLFASDQYVTVGTKTDGTLWTWGTNTHGTLGINNTISRSSPVQVGSNTNWSVVSSGRWHVAAVKTDNTLWTWGRNNNGQLGLSDLVSRSSPTQVTGTTWGTTSGSLSVCTIARGYCTMSVKTNNTLFMWGENNSGQLGLNSTINRSSPVQVGAGTSWSGCTMGEGSNSTAATLTTGQLFVWGNHGSGSLGLNDLISRSSPVQLGPDNTWSRLTGHNLGFLATKTNGTLWSWGIGSSGKLGLNDTNNRSSPTQIGANTNWRDISMSQTHALATKTDNTLWAWGSNNSGQLGQNDTINRSSPVQVGTGSTWAAVGGIAAGFYSSFGVSS